MTLKDALRRFALSPGVAALRDALATAHADAPVQVRDAAGSSPAFLLAALAAAPGARPLVVLMPDEDAARYLLGDLEHLDIAASHLPPTGQKPYDTDAVADPRPLIARAEVLQALAAGTAPLLIASADAVAERVAAQAALDSEATIVNVGERLDVAAFLARLDSQGFARTEFVEEPGELAVRGGLIDVYPFVGEYPVRIELFGDDVDSIREFDPATQRSVARLETARLLPNLDLRERTAAPSESVFDYLDPDAHVVVFDESRFLARIGEIGEAARVAFAARPDSAPEATPPETLFLTEDDATAAIAHHVRVRIGTFGVASKGEAVSLGATPQPPVGGKMEVLRGLLRDFQTQELSVSLFADTASQRARLGELLEKEIDEGMVSLHAQTLHEGFVLPAAGIALLTDHQIFSRYHRPSAHKSRRRVGGLSLRDLQNLRPGDFVVHLDHGIGKFAGMETIEVRGRTQEAVRLLFFGGDTLYVNVNALYKLARFTGQEGHQPQLTKLGSGQWEKTKARTKKRVKDIARDLIALYARRMAAPGHRFPKDTLWQRELEASFEYEDTPDQGAAAEAVKADMEKAVPMDRLVCGDVGFGKTEVAVRAAFKAVQDGKQVAVLVPTTILAAQHDETFRKRLEGYPVRIEQLSRFRTAAEQKETLAKLEAGEVDILIGTQRIAGKKIPFKNLGLLILDEEQKFGVAVKERLRELRANVDTLTLTATPIPRTLQFSLLGARDLSVIQTPPPNRQPIVTEIHSFSQELIRDAILHETTRGGQVFFVHNRVASIEEMAATIQAIVPGVRVRTAHGQMPPDALEDVMMAFIGGQFDVLVSTNIVESGIDVSNANTIIVNHAERFGLAEMHQLRGRVGRSDRKAFAYLLVPSIHAMTREARHRLQALEEFSDLGSGFNIAMRDLDIRGAGNLLGAEQSGFVGDIGYETYHRILEEAVQELRHDEFHGLFHEAPPPRASETVLDIDADALIPPDYVSNSVERLNLYRRIADADGREGLDGIRAELEDRFGATPYQVDDLLVGAELRLHAQRLRLARVQFKNERLWIDTPGPDDDAYFYETVFQPLLARLDALGHRYVLKDIAGKRLRVIVQNVPELALARDLVARLTQSVAAEEKAA